MFQRIKLTIQYDGTDFEGWQVQPGKPTIQGELQRVYSKLLNRPTQVVGSGRTDSGVHAYGQVAHIDCPKQISKLSLLRGANSLLPDSIRVIKVDKVEPNFHARVWAKKKTYRYVIEEGQVYSALYHRYSMHRFARSDLPKTHPDRIRFPRLDLKAMKQASDLLVGEHDFSAFCASGASTKTFTRMLFEVRFDTQKIPATGSRILTIRFTGSGFLKQMVRNLVGTLLLVGAGKLEPSEITDILASKDRKTAGPTAPARGLSLESVQY